MQVFSRGHVLLLWGRMLSSKSYDIIRAASLEADEPNLFRSVIPRITAHHDMTNDQLEKVIPCYGPEEYYGVDGKKYIKTVLRSVLVHFTSGDTLWISLEKRLVVIDSLLFPKTNEEPTDPAKPVSPEENNAPYRSHKRKYR